MLDRRKLAVPLFAQAGAFVVVLVIGGFTSHAAPKPPPGSQGTPGTAVTASPSSTGSPAPAKGPALKLSVKVTEDGTNGLSEAGDTIAGSQVRVLQTGSLASVAAGALSPAQDYAANVPAGQYQVCIDPPLGWGSAVRGQPADQRRDDDDQGPADLSRAERRRAGPGRAGRGSRLNRAARSRPAPAVGAHWPATGICGIRRNVTTWGPFLRSAVEQIQPAST